MLVERARAWLGAKIVQVGLKVSGFDAGKLDPGPALPDDGIADDEEEEPAVEGSTYVGVELNDRAREMVREGQLASSPTRPIKVKRELLAGSVAARIQEERERARRGIR